ncbi:family 16 glycosylhydrolase [Cerasicoccus arenae]|nr:family 16 glycosylhydrolase [Cerasicoccus arenae]MBK1858127.1 family 16 glycosylhydrolase [Cerasicoccus arenae]
MSSAEAINSSETENGASVSIEDGALKVSFDKSSSYPGVNLRPAGGAWNLSEYGGVEMTFVNNGPEKYGIGLRLDNPGNWKNNPWNTEVAWVESGQAKTIRVTFGQSYGNKGYALNPSQVNNIKILVDRPRQAGSISVQSLRAIGEPVTYEKAAAQPDQPVKAKQLKPSFNSPSISGELIDLSKKGSLSDYRTSNSSIKIVEDDSSYALEMDFGKGRGYPNVQFPIPDGGWNLEHFAGLQIVLKNNGDHKVRIGVRTDNPGNWKESPWNTDMHHIGPGETKTIQTVFGQENGAPSYPLNPVNISGIQVFADNPSKAGSIQIMDLRGYGTAEQREAKEALSTPEDRNVPAKLPSWIGKRPPVEGDWVMTLNENFDEKKLNLSLWTPRLCWDGPAKGETQRYLEENVTVQDGFMKILCEVNPGHQYNDPKLDSRVYATGAVTTLDKWTQRYGYFEARLKPPTARGLWPAFWLMPDRGKDSGLDIWQRRDTGAKNGKGMEIDIFEHLTEWGGGRYNIATHWDGYGSDHKQWGSSHTYYGPTEDGFHTAGLLWEPGKLTWYLDGEKKGEWENERIADVPAYIKFTIQMGSWATKNVDDAALPQYFEIDYVRAWQLKEHQSLAESRK